MKSFVVILVLAAAAYAVPADAQTQIADSRTEFSCTQGMNNWYYGYYTRNGPFITPDFRPMTQCVNDPFYYPGLTWWVDRALYWTSVRPAVSFPNGPASCGRQQVEHWAVRRWSSEVSGTITVTGTIRNVLGGFDGFTAHILVNGGSVFSRLIAGAGSTVPAPYAVTFAVTQGSAVDFVVQPNASDCNDHAEFIATIAAATPPQVLPPLPPANLTGSVVGSSVNLSWSRPTSGDPPTSYILEVGSAPAATNIASIDTSSTLTSFGSIGVPQGTYFLRVRARNQAGASGPSNEVVITVGPSGPCNLPGPPSNLTRLLNRSVVTLNWNPASGQFATYVVEAGSVSGASNLASLETGGVNTLLVATAPPGTYFVRVRARNTCGTGAASNEIVVIIP